MKRLFLPLLLLLPPGVAAEDAPPPDHVRVLYSLSIDASEMLTLSVYNPTDANACVPYIDWPGPGDALRVTGSDGRAWEYIGLEAEVMGVPKKLKISPRSEVSTVVDLRKSYKPSSGASSKLGRVYYGAVFRPC